MNANWLTLLLVLCLASLSGCAAREVRVVCQMAPPPGSADGASAGRELPVVVGKDIAVELYRLADDADEVAARLRALQAYSRAVAGQQQP